MLLKEVLSPKQASGGDEEPPPVASGAAALAKSREQSQATQQTQSARAKYQGDTVKSLQQRHSLEKAQRSGLGDKYGTQFGLVKRGEEAQRVYNQARARTSDDLAQTSQAQFIKTSPYRAQSVYDMRPDLKPRQITYRELFR